MAKKTFIFSLALLAGLTPAARAADAAASARYLGKPMFGAASKKWTAVIVDAYAGAAHAQNWGAERFEGADPADLKSRAAAAPIAKGLRKMGFTADLLGKFAPVDRQRFAEEIIRGFSGRVDRKTTRLIEAAGDVNASRAKKIKTAAQLRQMREYYSEYLSQDKAQLAKEAYDRLWEGMTGPRRAQEPAVAQGRVVEGTAGSGALLKSEPRASKGEASQAPPAPAAREKPISMAKAGRDVILGMTILSLIWGGFAGFGVALFGPSVLGTAATAAAVYAVLKRAKALNNDFVSWPFVVTSAAAVTAAVMSFGGRLLDYDTATPVAGGVIAGGLSGFAYAIKKIRGSKISFLGVDADGWGFLSAAALVAVVAAAMGLGAASTAGAGVGVLAGIGVVAAAIAGVALTAKRKI